MKQTIALFISFLLLVTPVLAQSPIENLASNLRAAGFQLVLLWLLTLALSFGLLSHVDVPKSLTARGIISIVLSFLVLLAATAAQAAVFLENLVTSAVLIAVGLLAAVIFLEIAGAKGEKHIFSTHFKFFAPAIIVLAILIFIGAGGLPLLNLPTFNIGDPTFAIIFFLAVMVIAVWIMFKETGGK